MHSDHWLIVSVTKQRKQFLSPLRRPTYWETLAFRFRQLRKYVRFSQTDVLTAWSSIIRVFREMFRALARLSLPIKISIGLAILVEFLVVTQWERLTFKETPFTEPRKSSIASQPAPSSPAKSEHRSFTFPDASPTDKAQASAVEAALAKRMARVVIEEPNVEANGSIAVHGQAFRLYGIKQFDSKKVCTKASGERWACGLQAYATLRNSIAHKEIICDPKTLLPNGVSAVCRMGSSDIVLILLRDGLAEIDGNIDNAEMADAQAFAKSQRLGIWDR